AAYIAEAAGARSQQQKAVHCFCVEASGKPREIRLRPVEPKRVGIDQKERRSAELRQRFGNAAASAEKPVAFVGDENARMPPPRQMPFDGIGQMMHIDDSELDAGF